MKKNKPDTYTQTKKVICDWCDKKNYLIHYKMLKSHIGHGMKLRMFKTLLHLNRVTEFKQTLKDSILLTSSNVVMFKNLEN